jgi:hypothetical protein
VPDYPVLIARKRKIPDPLTMAFFYATFPTRKKKVNVTLIFLCYSGTIANTGVASLSR